MDNIQSKISKLEEDISRKKEELKALKYHGNIFDCEYGKKLFATHLAKNKYGGKGRTPNYPQDSYPQDNKTLISKLAKDFIGMKDVNLARNIPESSGKKLELLANNICKAICDTLDEIKEVSQI